MVNPGKNVPKRIDTSPKENDTYEIEAPFKSQNANQLKGRESPPPGLASSLPETRIVLLGKTGAGKSATGNTILGEEKFLSEFSLISVTKQSMAKQAVIDGRLVSVVDTPGLFDTAISREDLALELGRGIYESAPGPHVFLIVLPLTVRYTEQEEQVIQLIRELFGEEALKYTIILFTHGDVLAGQDVKQFTEKNKALCELLGQCGQRYHVIENIKREDRGQVTELLDKIDRMVEENGERFYTNDMFKDAARLKMKESERLLRRQEERQRQEENKVERQTEEQVTRECAERMERFEREQEEEIETLKAEKQVGNGGGGGGGDGSTESGKGGFAAFIKRHWGKLLAAAAIGAVGGALVGGALVACGAIGGSGAATACAASGTAAAKATGSVAVAVAIQGKALAGAGVGAVVGAAVGAVGTGITVAWRGDRPSPK